MVSKERRVNKRVPVKFKVNCIHEDDYIISFSKDISADGMFIRSAKLPEVGQKVALYFLLNEATKMEVLARVVWVNHSGDEKDIGMGVKFIKPKTGVKRDILNFVNRVAILKNKSS